MAVAVGVSEMQQVTGDTRHVTHDTLHMTRDTGHLSPDFNKGQNSTNHGLFRK